MTIKTEKAIKTGKEEYVKSRRAGTVLRFALSALFLYANNEPKRSEANHKINKKRDAKLRERIKMFGSSTRSFASRFLFIF